MTFRYEDCKPHADGKRRALCRDGRTYVLLCNDAPGEWPIRGYADDTTGGPNGLPVSWRASGRQTETQIEYQDLVGPAPEAPRVVWINISPWVDVTGICGRVYYAEKQARTAVPLGAFWDRTAVRVELPR